ncbi:antitoxin [soil metagenome]|jgi:hypothetical protein
MRTTLTLDADVEALVRGFMRRRGLSFKEAVNQAIRASLGQSSIELHTPTFRMGVSRTAALDKAVRLSGELEDQELIRKLAVHR